MRASLQYPVVFCAPIQPHSLLIGSQWNPRRFINQDGRQLLALSPLIFSGHYKSKFINRINCWLIARYLNHILPPCVQIHLLTNTPFSLPVIENLYFRQGIRSKTLHRLVYDLIDDFTAFDWSPAFCETLQQRLLRISDKLITGTDALSRIHFNSVYIPSGVDYQLFANPTVTPPDIASMPAPVLGYYGTVSDRLDISLIKQLSARYPHGSIVLIGPLHLPAQVLPRAYNIHYLGPRRHDQLPGYAQNFHVGLIPFKKSRSTMVLNPVKTLEYLAAGLPVVATRLPDLQLQYSDVILLADSPDEFVKLVETALTLPRPDQKARGKSLAQSASWDTMVEKINEVLFTNSKTVNPDISEAAKS